MDQDKTDKTMFHPEEPTPKVGEMLSLQGSLEVAEEGTARNHQGKHLLRRIDLW
jgi:hypothetical protein